MIRVMSSISGVIDSPSRAVGVTLLIVSLFACGDGTDREYGGRRAVAWAEDLRSPDLAVRVRAADALYHIRPQSNRVVRALLLAMRDSVPEVQTAVAIALGAIGESGLPALTDAVRDDHASVRSMALNIIAGQGADAAAALPSVIGALNDSSVEVRAAAAFTLDRLGADVVGRDRSATAVLVSATRDTMAEVRAAAIRALLSVSSDSSLLWQIARGALADSAAAVRQSAVPLLLKAGRPPSAVVTVLAGLSRDSNSGVRGAAYRALGVLLSISASPIARQVLLEAAKDPDPSARAIAATVLAPRPPARIR